MRLRGRDDAHLPRRRGTAPRLPRRRDAPSAEYAARYNRFGGAEFRQNLNMTPDFPTAAVAIERLYERSRGWGVDGVVVVDRCSAT